jgi:hypothetical protein
MQCISVFPKTGHSTHIDFARHYFRYNRNDTSVGFPHSETSGSERVVRYPKNIAHYYVLHRVENGHCDHVLFPMR